MKFIGLQIVEEVMSLASHPVTGFLIMTDVEYYVIGDFTVTDRSQ